MMEPRPQSYFGSSHPRYTRMFSREGRCFDPGSALTGKLLVRMCFPDMITRLASRIQVFVTIA